MRGPDPYRDGGAVRKPERDARRNQRGFLAARLRRMAWLCDATREKREAEKYYAAAV
ncbi:hypothetical protein KBA01_05260 [Kozakia baliensis]|nr:hypothetical protein KBA01_05260 [Kozakia baliensis]